MKEITIQGSFGKVRWELPEDVSKILSDMQKNNTEEDFEEFISENKNLLKQFVCLFSALLLIPDSEYFSVSFYNTSMTLNSITEKIKHDIQEEDFSDASPLIKH